jgi:glycine C-acetyltransferase
MELSEASRYSLADFHAADSDDPLVPPADYTAWRSATTWATALYERALLAAPGPRTEIEAQGERRKVINLASYNYLGLAAHPETIAAAKAALDKYGTGACGSPILSGMTDLHRRLERELASFLGRESVMLFNSGFGGALGALAGVLRKGDLAAVDDKSHVCLIDGTRLSGATLAMFAHNDPRALDAVLTKAGKGRRRLVVLEGIYSMDGDVGALPALVDVAERHGVGVLIDEAHSILALGAHGRGAVESTGVEGRIGLQYATFSKAFASIGGFVAGDARLIDYLRFYADSYGFSCALPPSVVGGILKALEIATRDATLRDRLADNAAYFRRSLVGLGLDIGDSTSHVVPIILGAHRELLYMLSYALLSRGLFLAPVDYPSVPDDKVRFRASITAAHTRADLDEALDIIDRTIVRALKAAA